MDLPASKYEDAAKDGTGTMYEFPALANWGNVNKNRTMDKMYWSAMVQEEVQDHLKDVEKYDISVIDILHMP